jgi:hypothetical protein
VVGIGIDLANALDADLTAVAGFALAGNLVARLAITAAGRQAVGAEGRAMGAVMTDRPGRTRLTARARVEHTLSVVLVAVCPGQRTVIIVVTIDSAERTDAGGSTSAAQAITPVGTTLTLTACACTVLRIDAGRVVLSRCYHTLPSLTPDDDADLFWLTADGEALLLDLVALFALAAAGLALAGLLVARRAALTAHRQAVGAVGPAVAAVVAHGTWRAGFCRAVEWQATEGDLAVVAVLTRCAVADIETQVPLLEQADITGRERFAAADVWTALSVAARSREVEWGAATCPVSNGRCNTRVPLALPDDADAVVQMAAIERHAACAVRVALLTIQAG